MKREDERAIPAGSTRAINHEPSASLCLPRTLRATRPPHPHPTPQLYVHCCCCCSGGDGAAGDGAPGDGAAPAHSHICQDWKATDCAHYINRHSLTSPASAAQVCMRVRGGELTTRRGVSVCLPVMLLCLRDNVSFVHYLFIFYTRLI